MRNQRRTKTPYTVESIERALVHHSARGGVETWKRSSPTSKWVVTVPGYDPVELNDKEAWAFCVGLAAADRAAQPRVLREIGKDVGPVLLREARGTNALRSIAAGGGPVGEWQHLDVYCPLCHCNKSGSVNHCNTVTEACTDERCVCHDEDWPTR